MRYPVTPDGRYFVVKGRLWRTTNPTLKLRVQRKLTSELMAARRAVRSAKQSGDETAMTAARLAVHKAKVALGERGPVWWTDDAPDYNQRRANNTPYAEWFAALGGTD